MRGRALVLPFLCLTGFLALFAMAAVDVAVAEDPPANPNLWESGRHGFKWQKPNEPEWGFIPEEKWKDMFSGGKPDTMMAALAKYTVPGGQWGKDNHKVLMIVFAYPSDKKFNMGGKDIDAGNIKGMCAANFEGSQEWWKDLKNVKEPNVVSYKFDKKVYSYSYTAINKQHGQTGFLQGLFFKGNSKYTFHIDINCPSTDEKAVRRELDKVLNMITVGKPDKD